MEGTYRNLVYLGLIAVFCVFMALVPTLSLAQEDELSTTIRAALLSDPETANLSQADLDAVVAALAAEAEGQGVTGEDIAWRPQEPAPAGSASEQVDTCGGLPG